MDKTEYQIQTAFVNYLQLKHPDLLYTISPAGFIMSAGMAMKMMRMGYRKGTPDLTIYEPRGQYHGLFLEFKKPGGKVSPEQITFLLTAREKGYAAFDTHSTEEAISLLEGYLAPVS